MHKMYESVWKCAKHISKKCPFSNKTLFLIMNICIWIIIGFVLTSVILIYKDSNLNKLLWEIVGTGYIAVIFGFGGGIMYLLRNTVPGDIK